MENNNRGPQIWLSSGYIDQRCGAFLIRFEKFKADTAGLVNKLEDERRRVRGPAGLNLYAHWLIRPEKKTEVELMTIRAAAARKMYDMALKSVDGRVLVSYEGLELIDSCKAWDERLLERVRADWADELSDLKARPTYVRPEPIALQAPSPAFRVISWIRFWREDLVFAGLVLVVVAATVIWISKLAMSTI